MRRRTRRLWRAIKRQFTHPYGACSAEGCDEPAERWIGWCDHHYSERLRRAAEEHAQMKFNRQAAIVAEGMREVFGTQEEPPTLDTRGKLLLALRALEECARPIRVAGTDISFMVVSRALAERRQVAWDALDRIRGEASGSAQASRRSA